MTTNLTMTSEAKAPLIKDYNRNPQTEKHLAENPRKTVLLLLQGVVDKGNLAKVCHQSNALVEKDST